MEMEAESLTMQVGEDGAQIRLTQEAEIIAAFVRMEAEELDGNENLDNPEEFYKNARENDQWIRRTINTQAEDKLVDNYVNGREEVLVRAKRAVKTVFSVVIALMATTSTAGVAGIAVLGGLALSSADSDIGEGLDVTRRNKIPIYCSFPAD